jgi:hypothetical protein
MPIRSCRLLVSAVLLTLAAGAAHAASIDIDGVWGDKAGCQWVRGDYSSDVAVILRKDKIEGSEFFCDFTSAKKNADGSFSVRAACAQEGTETTVQIKIGPEKKSVRTITANKGWRFSPVSRCK